MILYQFLRVVFISVVLLFGLTGRAQGDDLPIRVHYKRAIVFGQDRPCITLTADSDMKNIKILLARQGKTHKFSLASIMEGSSKKLCWQEKPGRYAYAVGIFSRNRSSLRRKNLSIKISYLPPIQMVFDTNHSNLEKRRLVFYLNQPAERTELIIYNKQGRAVVNESKDFKGTAAGQPIELSWDKLNEEVSRIVVKAYSTDGFWTEMTLKPWMIYIPHEEVNFETNRWDIRPGEYHKLDDSIKKIHQAIKEHASHFKVILYVGGFTDTVGSNAHNRTLSTNRARAIARYFLKRGVRIPILYRGYGEEALAVATKDNVDEPRNRRAIYVLGHQPPMLSQHVTWGGWRPVGK